MKSLITLLIATSLFAHAETYDIRDQVAALQFHKDSYNTIYGKGEYARLEKFHRKIATLKPADQKVVKELIEQLDGFVPQEFLMPLVYHRAIEKNPAKVITVLRYLGHYRLNILKDVVDNPMTDANMRAAAKSVCNATVKDCDVVFGGSKDRIAAQAAAVARASNNKAFVEEFKRQELLSSNLYASLKSLPGYSLSWHRYIPGNKVELIGDNDRSKERIDWVNERAVFDCPKEKKDKLGVCPLDTTLDYMQMPTKENGYKGNPIWNDAIFARIRDMVASAQDSIFIDIFLFGGTMGGTLAKYIVDQTLEKKKKNPNFKVLILHDYATNYNMKDEILPAFYYIRDRIKKEASVRQSIYLLQANIQRHPPGIPFGITNNIEKTDAVFKSMEQKNTYFESKIDHSKVIVVDANTNNPQAYFGTKNWSDHSGSYYYDYALYVNGPAAALVQSAYWDDVEAALTTDPKEAAWFYYKEYGLGNAHYLDRKKQILDWFKVKQTSFPYIGSEVVRIAEANVDNRIKDTRNMIVDMIANAKEKIWMEHLFIYDKYIIDALLKKKKANPRIDIKILADHNGNFGFNGLPNSMFIKDLIEGGIEVRFKTIAGFKHKFKYAGEKSYHQEDHRKITTVDGKVCLIGSSNLNPDTLQGSFREFGAIMFDEKEIEKFEKEFIGFWDSEKESEDSEYKTKKLVLGKKELTRESTDLLNGIAATIIRSKDDLEERY